MKTRMPVVFIVEMILGSAEDRSRGNIECAKRAPHFSTISWRGALIALDVSRMTAKTISGAPLSRSSLFMRGEMAKTAWWESG